MKATWTTRKRFDWHKCERCKKYGIKWTGVVGQCRCGKVVPDAVSQDIAERLKRGYPLEVQ